MWKSETQLADALGTPITKWIAAGSTPKERRDRLERYFLVQRDDASGPTIGLFEEITYDAVLHRRQAIDAEDVRQLASDGDDERSHYLRSLVFITVVNQIHRQGVLTPAFDAGQAVREDVDQPPTA
jgi:hypothetical protein